MSTTVAGDGAPQAIKQEAVAATIASGSGSGSNTEAGSNSMAPPPLPIYFPSSISRPASMPKAYLNGTQDMMALFGLMPIYDRAVRPYNPETLKAQADASTSATGQASAANIAGNNTSNNTAGGSSNMDPNSKLQNASNVSGTPRGGLVMGSGAAGAGVAGLGANTGPASAGGAGIGTLQSQAPSSGLTSTPALQLNGGPPSFSLPTDSSALLGQSPGQVAASAAAAPPAKKPTKPPPTYAHYVQDLAGRVRPPRRSARNAVPDPKGPSLMSILHKPEYTPQNIVPFDRETITSAFKVQSGEVAEIDQALLEPDEEEQPRKKKKKKNRDNPQHLSATATATATATAMATTALPTPRR